MAKRRILVAEDDPQMLAVDDETRAKAERLGAVFFNKPFSLLALRQMVTRLLG